MQHIALSEAAAAPLPPSQQASNTAEPPPPSFDSAVDSSVQQLMQMGFSKEASVAALQKAQGSVEAATDILLGGFQ